MAQQKHRDHRGRDQVDHPGGGGAADHPEVRQEQERPEQPADECTEIVGGVEVGQHPPAVGGPGGATALQQRHQQRHLGADEAADQRRADHQHPGRTADERERDVQRGGGEAADDPEQRLHGDERDRGVPQQGLTASAPAPSAAT